MTSSRTPVRALPVRVSAPARTAFPVDLPAIEREVRSRRRKELGLRFWIEVA